MWWLGVVGVSPTAGQGVMEEVFHRQQEEARHPQTSGERLEILSADPDLRTIVAGNPAAPAELLERLARDQMADVRRTVASNPNTPWPILEQLAYEFPHEFLHNPMGPLQMLERPEQISTSGVFWDGLLREASIPSLWWNWLKQHPTLRMSPGVRLHIQYAGETAHPSGCAGEEEEDTLLMLTELLTAASPLGVFVPTCVEQGQAGPSALTAEQTVQKHLRWLAHSDDREIRAAIAENTQTPVELLQMLARDQDASVRERVARHERTPVKVLRALAQDLEEDGVARNPQAPSEVFQCLVQDEAWGVKNAVARHKQASTEVLRTLSQDESASVRVNVAWNEHTPEDVLQDLAQDARPEVRAEVAANAQTPVEILQMLAQDQDWRGHLVRRAVAGNWRTPASILRTLALDEMEWVRELVAENGQTPVEVLPILAQDGNTDVRRAVARKRQTPVDVLRILAQDQDVWVRYDVASHPQLPEEVLRTLALDSDERVRWIAKLAQEFSLESMEQPDGKGWGVLSFWDDDDGTEKAIGQATIEKQLDMVAHLEVAEHVRQAILDALVTDWDFRKIRDAFAMAKDDHAGGVEIVRDRREHSHHLMAVSLPPMAWQKLAASPHWEIRYLVALNSRPLWEPSRHLSQDGNRYVRAIARATLKHLSEQATPRDGT